MDSSNADPWEGLTGQSQADADDALIMDPLVRQISELRAALGDSEARRAELEAVIQKTREAALPTANGEPLRERVIGALDVAPTVVLEDRDREVAASTLEKYADSLWSPSAYYLRSCAAAIRAGGNTFPEQHVRGLYSDELQTMVDELREAHRIAKDWSHRNEDASEVASYVRNALDVLEVELAEWPRAAAIRKGDTNA